MNARDRAEERVAEFLAAREGGHTGSLDEWLADEPTEVRVLAQSVQAEVEGLLGALALGSSEAPVEGEAPLDGPNRELAPPSTDPRPSGYGWRYDRGREIGRGGNGSVLEVFDRTLERRLAMKILSPEHDPIRAARRRARFRAEARLAGRLQHPGVVAVHELGRTPEGDDYFTMPKVEGETLGALIRRGRAGDGEWTRTRLLDVLVRVAETLAFAHARGVMHRDVKPANVMVGAFGETYVLDWGLARATDAPAEASERAEPLAGDAGLTGRGDVVGTPAYMPPEQAGVGQHPVGAAADVYALGATLHEVLTGEPPFGRGADSFEVLRRLTIDGPPELDVERHRVAPELAAIRARAMRADPTERYPSAGGFARDLRAYLEGRVVSAYESGGWAELRKWIGRNRGLAAALAATLLAIVGGVALAVWTRAQERAASLRFLDLQLVMEASESARGLWPATADDAERLERWLAEADALLGRGDRHRRELIALDVEADARRERPRSVDDARWTFDDRDARWRHEKLAELVAALDAFAAPGGPRDRVAAGLARVREVWPSALEAQTEAWERLQVAWSASPVYSAPPPEPIAGLAPLGIDPASGLAEFALVGSGLVPDGPGLDPRPEHAVVLAAIPSGRFEFGIDQEAEPFLMGNELRPVEVELAGYLLGRFELTRAQYQRLVRGAPPSDALALYPTAGVSQREATEVLREWGLELPTEARWERAAELGWPGPERLVTDRAERFDQAEAVLRPLLPIGARPRDRAGFGDLLGNLAEFCRDPLLANDAVAYAPGDGLARPTDGARPSPDRCYARGGHYGLVAPELPQQTIAFARPEFRVIADAGERADRYGIRVARSWR